MVKTEGFAVITTIQDEWNTSQLLLMRPTPRIISCLVQSLMGKRGGIPHWATGSHLDLPQPSPLHVGEEPGKLSNKG
jgi:hypothetical protein